MTNVKPECKLRSYLTIADKSVQVTQSMLFQLAKSGTLGRKKEMQSDM